MFRHKFYQKYVQNETIEDKRHACVTMIKEAWDYIESHGLTVKTSSVHYRERPNQAYDRVCPCLDIDIRIFQILNAMDGLYTDYKGL